MPTRSFIDCCSSGVQRVRVLRRGAVVGVSKGASAILVASSMASCGDCRAAAQRPHVVGGAQPGAAAEDQQVRQRVAAQPVGAVHAARALAGGEQPGGRGTRRCRDRPRCRPSRSGRWGRLPSRSLVMSTSASSMNWWYIDGSRRLISSVGMPRGDVEVDPAVRGAAARLDLGDDGAGDLVAGQQVRGATGRVVVLEPLVGFFLGFGVLALEHRRDVVEHEPLALGVLQTPRRRRGRPR